MVSVIVCTRDRPQGITRAVSAILSCAGSFELIVIDQSTSDDTESVLSAISDRRLRYVCTQSPGKDRALNLGISLANSEVIACTDDDCEPAADWVSEIDSAFHRNPDVGVLFTSVTGAPSDESMGFTPVFQPSQE